MSISRLEFTPVHLIDGIYVKRDDLYQVAGVNGGKARTCWHLAQGAKGLVTAGARSSPQVNIVARVARELGIPARCHMPEGAVTEQAFLAAEAGAEIIRHKAGYNSVIVRRAKDDALETGYTEIPFGMECTEAVRQTSKQLENLPFDKIKRIVIPVGSGMSLCGILSGLRILNNDIHVLGCVVGADPSKRIRKFAPPFSRNAITLVASDVPYHKEVSHRLGDLELDRIYEGKCLPFLEKGDLLWVVGIRNRASDYGLTFSSAA